MVRKRNQYEPNYAAVHAMLIGKIGGIANTLLHGECWEIRIGDNWIAYNPHPIATETTKGQRLDPHTAYIEGPDDEGVVVALALIGPDGGMTINGGTTGPMHEELVSLFAANL